MKTLIASAIVVFLAGGVFVMWKNTPSLLQALTQVTSTTTNATSGFATTTRVGGKLHYTNTFLGLSFILPTGWHIDRLSEDTLGHPPPFNYGQLSLLNFDEIEANMSMRKGFLPGENSIWIHLLNTNVVATSSDNIEQSRNTTQVKLTNGQTATKVSSIYISNNRINTYVIPAPKQEYLHLSIYGDPKNFYLLDDLVNSLRWSP